MIRDRIRRSLGVAAAADVEDLGYGTLAAFVTALQGTMTAAGVTMTPERALQISTVYGCIVNVVEPLATLPLILYRRTSDGGKERATDHPVYELLHTRPNSEQTAAEFRSLLQTGVEQYGNGYAALVRIGGDVREMVWMPSDAVRPRRRGGELRYVVSRGASLDPLVLRPDEVLHLRGPFGKGDAAAAPCEQFRDLFGLSWALDAYVAWSIKKGARIDGTLETPNKLSDKARANLVEFMRSYQGGDSEGTAILEEGLKYSKIAQTHDEARIVELGERVDAKIARVHRVPMHMLASNITQPRANMEQQGQEFVTYSLQSRAVRFEQRISLTVLPPGGEYFAEHLFDGLQRGDLASRVDAYVAMVTNGLMSPNEARSRENMNPRDGGDDFMQPLNMGPAGGGGGGSGAMSLRDRQKQRNRADAAQLLEDALARLAAAR